MLLHKNNVQQFITFNFDISTSSTVFIQYTMNCKLEKEHQIPYITTI
jgi:hypothetical protein